MRQQEAFFHFLQFCIGSVEKIPTSIKEVDWKVLYASKHPTPILAV